MCSEYVRFFVYPGILPLPYHFCSTTPRKHMPAGSETRFQFQNHYRPCVGHATARATPDCVHRVTVLCHCALCCRPCPGCATLLVLCDCVLLGCTHPLLCSMCAVSIPPGRRWLVGNGGEWQVPSQIPTLVTIGKSHTDQTKTAKRSGMCYVVLACAVWAVW